MNSTTGDANQALQTLSPMPGLSEKTSFLSGWKRDKQRLGSKRGVHVPFSILKTMKPFSKNFRKEELPVYWLSVFLKVKGGASTQHLGTRLF
jgi:hypothetical protein